MTTITEFYTSMSNGVHEARFVVTDFLSSKASIVTDYVSNHPSEFLYGSVSLSLLALACYLTYKLVKADNLNSELLQVKNWYADSAERWKNSARWTEGRANRIATEAIATKRELSNEVAELRMRNSGLALSLMAANENFADMESSRDWFQEMYDESAEENSTLTSDLENLQGELDDLQSEYAELQEENSDLGENWAELFSASVTLRFENNKLKSLADSYKELTAMNDNVFAQAA